MVSGHVESLLSDAYDGELSPEARAAFDRHLGQCSACATAFAELTTAVDALREQPPARMPHPVRLPERSPVPERRWFGVPAWIRLPEGRRLVGGLTAAGVVAAAGVAAFVVLNPSSGTGNTTRSQSSVSSGSGAFGAAPAKLPQSSACTGGCAPPEAVGLPPVCPSQTLNISAASAAEIPDGFNNQATHDDGITDVILATQSLDYTPGETVDIYSRVIDDGAGVVSLPCTLLAGPGVGGSSAALEAPASATYATPAGTLTVGGQPLLKVAVPRSASAGQTYQIVAEVPAGAGEAQAKQVTLTIQVT